MAAVFLAASAGAGAALAQQCKDFGDLRYIGRNAAETRTFWLSTTARGGYRLEAAEGNTGVDSWERTAPGPHVSVSPFVSSGSGGVHRLFARGAAPNGSDCLVDTQNQKNGILFPALPPSLPGRPTPPIGMLPPGGALNGLPGRPSPPIATLPPSGVLPGVPGRPTPPIGAVPPTGVMPGLTSRPTPPIGTLPPSGVMPGLPTRPTPPIATLPPAGAMPDRPGRPTAPIGTLSPGGVSAPVSSVGDYVRAAPAPCAATDAKYGYVPCDPVVMSPAGAPLTPGRDLGGASPWNAWADFTSTRIDDDRGPLDTEVVDNNLAIGLDYLFRPGLVAGVQLESDRTETEDASGLIEGSTTSAAIGAYFAAETARNWVVSGLFSLGRSQTDLRIASLEGDYTRDRARMSLTASGQYIYRGVVMRPSATLDYIRFSDSDYTLSGPVLGAPQTVFAEVPTETYATVTPELELSRPFMAGDDVVMPYLRLGLSYDFDTGGGSLPAASSSGDRLSGQTRIGTRMRLGRAFFADASLGYLSAFQDDLDVVEGRFHLAMSF